MESKKETNKINKRVKKTVKKSVKKKVKKKKRGFTLIELLAVIVILGLLMAIAIPSITKYITQSRRKTVVSSIDGYISSALNSVNDQDYKFTTPNTIYALPIECIPLEKGGTNPFGEWLQANDDYWAYVLVQYDSKNFSYIYGFTFKDSAGYGMYPTSHSKINSKSTTQIKTGLELSKPKSGSYTNIASKDNWSGFNIDNDTKVIVLVAETENIAGNGETTCTLCQKGSNYDEIEQEKEAAKPTLANLIKKHNTLITATPTFTDSSNNSSDKSGLYASTATTNDKPSYYFRGKVKNNYVKFAGLTWRIIRINEDGTVRIMLTNRINSSVYSFNSLKNNYEYVYYSNSNVKPVVDNWYINNIKNKGYDDYVATGIFCEQAKATINYTNPIGSATATSVSKYTPDFKCSGDANGKGIVINEDETLPKVGLITYDETVFAGAYSGKINRSYYLSDYSVSFWTMSPESYGYYSGALIWFYSSDYSIVTNLAVNNTNSLVPVINLKSNLMATGTGTSTDPYEVITE